ncbi:MAG: sulfatase [Firmicutes bacterium]|nr:sulfatase [Bacillota bacterium]
MKRPNIIFIMADDHAAHAMSCYGSEINETPNLDRIADEGMVLENCFCVNSICAPSRAAILTGKHGHLNGIKTLSDRFDGRQQTFPKILQAAGYQTAIVGKWHLGEGGHSSPTGFDYWNVLPGQGDYVDPVMIKNGEEVQYKGYVTDIITDLSLKWLQERDPQQPFMLLCHHKSPHRPWIPSKAHASMYSDTDIPLPKTFNDDYSNRSQAAKEARMRIECDFNYIDLKLEPPTGVSEWTSIVPPEDLDGFSLKPAESDEAVTFSSHRELKEWMYQRYIKDYLRCIASIDDNVGRILNFLDTAGLAENTIVIYTSDQGFFLGDHGWYDKRFMYEESLRMPFVVRYPKEIEAGSRHNAMALNLDFASSFLDYAGLEIPEDMQGVSLRPIFRGETPADWRTSMYYRYWMHLAHHYVAAHYGMRTERYKLIHYYGEALGTAGSIDESKEPEWELFDLHADPDEMKNLYHDPVYKDLVQELKTELYRLKDEALDFE